MAKNIKDVLRDGRVLPKRVDLVGSDGVNIQNRRREKAKTPKAIGRDVQQRMKEYKQGYVERTIDKVKRYK